MGSNQLTFFVISLLFIYVFVNVMFVGENYAQTTPDVYVGVDLAYGGVAEAKALIDKVSSFTNLFVVGSTAVTWYPNRVNETFQYAYDEGLNIISLPPGLPDYSSVGVNKTEWYRYANITWGNRVLGFYYLDEPAGRLLDGNMQLTGALSKQSSYADVANHFTETLSGRIDSNLRSQYSYKAFTSDYALYWFDYEAGYDAIFAEFGWNCSRELTVALCRGAATVRDKEWGVMITWTYNHPPYIESGEELYRDLVFAYDSGAKYIVVFDGNEGWTQGILMQEHLDALQQFWDYVQNNPRKTVSVSDRAAYVLPEAYGFGFRGPQDHIWGLWEADALSKNLSIGVASLLNDYGEGLDIIYDGLQSVDTCGYRELFYWDSYRIASPEISFLSPENKTYSERNVTLSFRVDKPVTWIGYSLDNQEQVTITENVTLSNLSVGHHTIAVYAKDNFDVMGVSETIYFNIAPSEPSSVNIVLVIASVSVAVVSIGSIVYLRKRKKQVAMTHPTKNT